MKILLARANGEFAEENLDEIQVNGLYRGEFSDLGRQILSHDIETFPYIYDTDAMPLEFFVVYYSKNNGCGEYNKGVSEFLPLDAGLCFGSAIFLKLSKDEDGYCLAGLKRKEIDYFKKEIRRYGKKEKKKVKACS